MRKVFLALVFLALSFLISFFIFPQKALAVCTVNVNPGSIAINHDGNISLSSIDVACFGINVPYKIVAYPADKTIKSVNKPINEQTALSPVIGSASSNDGKTINTSLNFNDEKSIVGFFVFKPHDFGLWNVIVCSSKTETNKCDEDIVAKGQLNVSSIPLTPTPTPQPDQPIIDHAKQDSCTFQVSYDNTAIRFYVENVHPETAEYEVWTDWSSKVDVTKDLRLIPQTTPSLSISPSPTPPPPLYSLLIAKANIIPPKNKHPEREEGHLFCIDMKEKEKDRRTGANCLRLFFTSGKPEGNTACTEANSGEVTPSPIPNLPPCSNWIYLNNTAVPTPQPTGTQEEYIRQNNLRGQIKCATIDTAIGNISTDPFQFVKSVLSKILSLAGGITVIMIIIAGYRLMTSQGNPEVVKAAQEQLTSAIVGFLFIIFSLVILQVIGVDILRIPGFTK